MAIGPQDSDARTRSPENGTGHRLAQERTTATKVGAASVGSLFQSPSRRMPVTTGQARPRNLKPGDFDKPPGKPRQYYCMNDYENECPILRATTRRRLSGKRLGRINIHALG